MPPWVSLLNFRTIVQSLRQPFQRMGDPAHRVVKPSHLGPMCPNLRQLFQLFHIGILRMVDPSSLQRMIAPSDQQLAHRVVEQYHRLVKIHPAFPSMGHIFATIGQLSQTLPMERTGDPSERWSTNNWRWALSLTTTGSPLSPIAPQVVHTAYAQTIDSLHKCKLEEE